MEFTLTLENANKLQRLFYRAPEVSRVEYRKSLERIASHVTAGAQKRSPVGKYKSGGNLRQSIRYQPYGASAFMVRVNAHYGAYVEFGTKPHVIFPKTKKVLAWKTDSGWRFAKRVNHPGTKAQPFFGPAIEDAEKYANGEMSRAMDRVLNSIN